MGTQFLRRWVLPSFGGFILAKLTDKNKQDIARSKLREIYENSNSKQRLKLANTLGFKGQDRVKRDSLQRLISPRGKKRSRDITPDKYSTINRSYGQLTKDGGRIEKRELIILGPQQKANVTRFFKPWVRPFQKIRNKVKSPYLVIKSEYRIMGYVGVIVRDQQTGNIEGRSFDIWHDGISNDFTTLASMLQTRIDSAFENSKGAYRFLGICFSQEGGQEMIRILEPEVGVELSLPTRINGAYGVNIYSAKATGVQGQQFEEVVI